LSTSSELETWLIEVGAAIIEKQADRGAAVLTPRERLIHCLWVADYGMRNAGDLVTAADLYADFQDEGARMSAQLGLGVTRTAFELPTGVLQDRYFDLFDRMCEEIRAAAD